MYNRIFKYFKPAYDEIATFLMAIAFVLVYAADAGLREGIAGSLEHSSNPKQDVFVFMFVPIFILGFFLSICHVFSKRKKTFHDKTFMLVFAMTMNGIAAIASGMYLLKIESGLLRIFTVWNIINGVMLLYQIGMIEEGFFLDDDANICQVCIGGVAVLLLFYVCYYIFDLYWGVTFSICVCYATTISRYVNFNITSFVNSNKK